MKKLYLILALVLAIMPPAKAIDWKEHYKAFNKVEPSEEGEDVFIKAFETELANVELKDLSFEEAIDKLRMAHRAMNKDIRLSFIIDGDIARKKVKLVKAVITFGDALDQLCLQAGAVWDFSAKIRVLPRNKLAEQVAAPDS
ncbi:hypothetical protein HW115_19210 [Verrucomicrobiaceae bacterium N1E253]|uniref:Uncharacterized protein n=1 Tax=Oceaniferula marina TaxID=2748318 RepID=A0A851GK91_9BACT|nr:hypothetical protein [Oceaniferula marina]NWK57756.1 hypothetical protein [Oceaniferula marina]